MPVVSKVRATRGYGLSEAEGEAFWLFGQLVTIKISADDAAGQYCLIDAEVPPDMAKLSAIAAKWAYGILGPPGHPPGAGAVEPGPGSVEPTA